MREIDFWPHLKGQTAPPHSTSAAYATTMCNLGEDVGLTRLFEVGEACFQPEEFNDRPSHDCETSFSVLPFRPG